MKKILPVLLSIALSSCGPARVYDPSLDIAQDEATFPTLEEHLLPDGFEVFDPADLSDCLATEYPIGCLQMIRTDGDYIRMIFGDDCTYTIQAGVIVDAQRAELMRAEGITVMPIDQESTAFTSVNTHLFCGGLTMEDYECSEGEAPRLDQVTGLSDCFFHRYWED